MTPDGGLVSRLWSVHVRAEFPARLRGEELAGVDMVMLDADIAGCVDAWLSNRGSLDDSRKQLVGHMLQDLDRVLPLLDDPQESTYFTRLREMALLVADPLR